MRILIVGSDYTWSIERYFLKYLREHRANVVNLFPAQNILYEYLNKSIVNKVKHRLKITSIYNYINKLFIRTVDELNPEIIWVFKGMEISASSLMYAKSKGIKLVNYNPDNPYIFTGRGSGNRNVVQSIKQFDLYMTYSLDIMTQLESQDKVKTKLLPFAFEVPKQITLEKLVSLEEVNKVCFIGNPDKDRANIIDRLASSGVEIDLYGNDWSAFVKHKNIKFYQPVYGEKLWYSLRRYRVQLNILRKHNLTSHNMRSFEIPGIGGIQLAPYTKEHNLFFDDQKEIFMYNDSSEAISKINCLLRMSTAEAEQIRSNAAAKCELKGYTYRARAKEVHEVFDQL